MSLVLGMSPSNIPRASSYGRSTQTLRENSKVIDEEAFSSLLIDTVLESMADILGESAVSILVSKGMLDNADNPTELEKQLSLTFGNGSVVLERMIVKALYQKLRIPYDSSSGFNYAKALDVARDVVFVEMRRR
jgi:hypothetical protein